VKLAVPVFPELSVALHVIVVVPIGKRLPELGGPHVAVTLPSTASVALAEPYEAVAPEGDVAGMGPTSAGGVTTGSVVSTTSKVALPESLINQ
jgi:hypothetical protein